MNLVTEPLIRDVDPWRDPKTNFTKRPKIQVALGIPV